MASTDMQWLFYLDERIMGLVLLYSLFCLFDNRLMIPIGFIQSSLVILLISLTIVQMSFATTAPSHYPNNPWTMESWKNMASVSALSLLC